MQSPSSNTSPSIIGTLGGTLLSIVSLSASGMVNTVVMAAIGAATSYLVTLLLKHITTRKKTE